MFRHGKPRAFIHDLRLASMLSFVAGIVNISGVLAIHMLTTNVTGHFAFFAEEFVAGSYQIAWEYISFILSFLFGAFVSNFLVEILIRKKSIASHWLPILLEILVLVYVVIAASQNIITGTWIARILLFAMGLQNALVTKISQATVRTTHLTGLFTDLGIELSQLIFYRQRAETRKLSRSIKLRLAIIAFFFSGGVLGGFGFREVGIYTLLLAAASLLVALGYDNLRLGFHYYRRKILQKQD